MENINIIKVPSSHKPFWTLKNVITFTKTMIKVRKKFDVVFTRMIGLHLLVPAIVAKIFFGKKFVMFISGSMQVIKNKKNRMNRPIIKIALKLADRICTHSESSLEDMELHLGKKLDRSKIIFLSHYVDLEKFKPENTPIENFSILSIGNIIPIKNFEILIEVAANLKEKFPDLIIKIAGPIKNQKYFKNLEDLIIKLNVQKNVKFIGSIPHNDIVDIINRSTIFVSTSKAVGVSTVIAEAMACKKPVISVTKGSIPQSSNDCINGFIVNPNPSEIENKIVELLENSNLRKKIGEAARETALKQFNETKFINNLQKIFRDITNSR